MNCSEHLFIWSIYLWKCSREILLDSFLIRWNKNCRWKHLEIYWQSKIFSLLSFFFVTDETWMLQGSLLFITFMYFTKCVTLKTVLFLRLYKILVILYHMSPNSYEAGLCPSMNWKAVICSAVISRY